LLTLGCTEGETSTKLKLIILFYEFSIVHLTQIPSTWQCQQTPVHLHWVLGGRGKRSSVPGPRSLVPAPWSQVLGPRSLVPGPWSQVLGPRSSVLGSRSLVPGPWSRVLGPESLVPGPWSQVVGSTEYSIPYKCMICSLKPLPPNSPRVYRQC